MKFLKRFAAAAVMTGCAALLLASCGTGSAASPPTNITAVAGDSHVVVSFTGQPGVTYWLFFANAAGVTPDNCIVLPGCQILPGLGSPTLIAAPFNGQVTGFTVNGTVTGLTNGSVYSFAINARQNNGPGGPASPAVSFTPRLAGATWVSGVPPVTTSDFHGAAEGTAPAGDILGNGYVAVGTAGAVYYSSNASTWTAGVVTPATTANLNAAVAYGNMYLAAGDGGVILLSPDAVNWTPQVSGTANALYGLASNGAGSFVAVGAGGTILSSAGGAAWTAQKSGTPNNLFAVTYANGKWVAAGAAGTLLTSTDAITWTPATAAPLTTADLRGVAYGGLSTTSGIASGTNTFVVVGAAGTRITSVDGGVTWVLQAPITTLTLNGIAYGHQFIAVGASGGIFTSTDGMTWATQPAAPGNLFAVANGSYDYLAVGAAGLNMNAR